MRDNSNDHLQGEDNRDGNGENEEQTLERFRQALEASAPPDGLARLRNRVRSEMATQRHRNQPSRIAPTRIAAAAMAAAAVVLASLAVIDHSDPTAIACPHGDDTALEDSPSEKVKTFLLDPDRFPRICSCSPAYSGELRTDDFDSMIPDAFDLGDPTRMTQ